MGCRGQVLIKPANVYLYTHHGADSMIEKVKIALRKQLRWNDNEYLTRIIFDVMTENVFCEVTGYGIGTEKHGDIERLITVDCGNQTVIIDESMYGGKKHKPISFDKFIE